MVVSIAQGVENKLWIKNKKSLELLSKLFLFFILIRFLFIYHICKNL